MLPPRFLPPARRIPKREKKGKKERREKSDLYPTQSFRVRDSNGNLREKEIATHRVHDCLGTLELTQGRKK